MIKKLTSVLFISFLVSNVASAKHPEGHQGGGQSTTGNPTQGTHGGGK